MKCKGRGIGLFWVWILFIPGLMWGKIDVVVSIVPQKTFVEKIGGDHVEVTAMVKPGANPATYEPKPSQMKRIAEADLYFAVGVPFEKAWLPRFAAQNPNMKIVDTTRGIQKRPMARHHHHEEGSHHSGHSHDSPDPHVWLSPRLVKIQARNIAEALMAIDPAHEAAYRRNLKRFEAEIDEVDQTVRKILTPCRGETMMVFHPSWGYFARDYGLKQVPVEIEGKEPKSRKLLELIHEAEEEGVKALFVQPQFSTRTAKAIAKAIGAQIVTADPLAPDWAENLVRIARSFCKAAR
ncbi:metal ABC transporter solute-binding protein, Zn/Mn family [Hydrogenimonas sp.]